MKALLLTTAILVGVSGMSSVNASFPTAVNSRVTDPVIVHHDSTGNSHYTYRGRYYGSGIAALDRVGRAAALDMDRRFPDLGSNQYRGFRPLD